MNINNENGKKRGAVVIESGRKKSRLSRSLLGTKLYLFQPILLALAMKPLAVSAATGGALVRLDGSDTPVNDIDLIAVAVCPSFGLAIKANSTVIGWGGQFDPVVPANLSNVVAVAVGCDGFGLALHSDGTVVGWGIYPAGNVPAGLSNVVAIAAGNARAYALVSDGTIATWGSGFQQPPLSNVVAITGAYDSGLALLSNGTAISWGYAGPGIFSGETNLVAVSLGGSYVGGIYPLGLRADGTVAGGGVPGGLSNATAISSGGNRAGGYGLVLKSDGTVVGTGAANVTASLSHVTGISATGGYGLVITRWPVITAQPQNVTNQPGTTVTFAVTAKGAGPFSFRWQKDGADVTGANGSSLTLQNVQAGDLGTYTAVVGNNSGSVTSSPATLNFYGMPQFTLQPSSQTVFSGARVGFAASATGLTPLYLQWYHNGALITGATSTSLTIGAVTPGDAGSYLVIASNSVAQVPSSAATLQVTAPPVWQRSAPGTVLGLGGPAIPPGLTNVVAVAAGTAHGLALRSDGTVVGWGRILFGEGLVSPGLSNVVAISAGDDHSMALLADGTVVGWGDTIGASVPAGSYGIVTVAAGYQHSLAIKSDGSVVNWTTTGSSDNPPASFSNAIAIDAGFDSDIGLQSNGTVVTWGGLLNPGGFNPTGLSNIVAVSMGRRYYLALRSDGHVAGGGVPAGLSNVVAIAAGTDSLGLALKSDGTVVGWGGLNVPEGLTGVTAIAAGGFGLVITTNPTPPTLAGEITPDRNFVIQSPVSVSGYVLEGSDNPLGAFSEVFAYTNSFLFTNSEPGFRIPAGGTSKFFRLRKQ